jgi:hypothetical protein
MYSSRYLNHSTDRMGAEVLFKTSHWESERNLLGILGTCNCFFEVVLPEGCILLVLMHLLQYHESHKPGLISYHILTKKGTKQNLVSKNCKFREVRIPSNSALIDSSAFSIIIHSRD